VLEEDEIPSDHADTGASHEEERKEDHSSESDESAERNRNLMDIYKVLMAQYDVDFDAVR
jgi:hypothetical protein